MLRQPRRIRGASLLTMVFVWPIVVLAVALAVARASVATEVVSVGNDFMVSRDFAKIVLEGQPAREARIFVGLGARPWVSR